MASSYDNYIDDFMRLSGQALTNNSPGANIPQTQDNQNAMDASSVDQRNQNITAVSSSNQNNQNNIGAAPVDQRNQNITDTSSVNRIYKPNTTLSIYQNNRPKAVPSLRQTHKPTKPTPLRQNITSASLRQTNQPVTSSTAFSTKLSSQDNLGYPIPLHYINGPSVGTATSPLENNQNNKPHSASGTTDLTLDIKHPNLIDENPNLAIANLGQEHTGKEKHNLTDKDEQNLDDRDKQSINTNGNPNLNIRDKQSTNNNDILSPSLTKDPRLHLSTLGLAISDKDNLSLKNKGIQKLSNEDKQNNESTTNSAGHPGFTVKQPGSSIVTSSSIANPHDSTSTSTSTNGSTTDSSSSVEDPNPESPSTRPPSPLPVFDHLELFDPNHQTKPYIDPRYDPSLTLAQRLEASTDLPLAPFSDYEWKKENEYVYLTSWQPADRRGRNTKLGEY
jgi:hypothetical protein